MVSRKEIWCGMGISDHLARVGSVSGIYCGFNFRQFLFNQVSLRIHILPDFCRAFNRFADFYLLEKGGET